MKIALVGYGKMGHMIAECAKNLGHEIVATIDVFAEDCTNKIEKDDVNSLVRVVKSSGAEGIIEFSHPTSVMQNIKVLLPLGLPLVVGTTGWNDKYDEVKNLAIQTGGTIMTSANFSIGVNMLYKIIDEAVKIMEKFPEYDIATWEMHHNQKADSPSGTALEIARHILANTSRKTEIVTDAFNQKPKPNELHVSSTRLGSVPGTHAVYFDSKADTIEIKHTARSREGFAMGAVHSLEKLHEKLLNGDLAKGNLYFMSDLF